MSKQELIHSRCNELHDQCSTLAMYYYHVTQRIEFGGDVTETMAIVTGLLDSINEDTVDLRKLLELDEVVS